MMTDMVRAIKGVASTGAVALLVGCGGSGQKAESGIHIIRSASEYTRTIESAGDKLLVIDLYADWCGPCRMLAPTLEELSATYKGRVDFYKVNTDNNPEIARVFNVNGIPHIAFMRKKNHINSLVGLNPKEAYVEAIEKALALP
jgi:thioredoxin